MLNCFTNSFFPFPEYFFHNNVTLLFTNLWTNNICFILFILMAEGNIVICLFMHMLLFRIGNQAVL